MDPRASFPLAATCKKWARLPLGIQKMIKKAAWQPTPSAKAFKEAFRFKKVGDKVECTALGKFGTVSYHPPTLPTKSEAYDQVYALSST